MINASKVSGLFLGFVLLYLSLSPNYGYILAGNDQSDANTNKIALSWYSESSININLTKPNKSNQKSFNNYLVYSFKGYVNDLKTIWEEEDSNSSILSGRYISFSHIISHRLEVRTIIFPFHFFL
jgi:hypothetical protein